MPIGEDRFKEKERFGGSLKGYVNVPNDMCSCAHIKVSSLRNVPFTANGRPILIESSLNYIVVKPI